MLQTLKHYFYAAKDGDWYIGLHEPPDDGEHKFVTYYSEWYDGYHRALWIGRLSIELHY